MTQEEEIHESDLAVAIGEHAFRAGWEAAKQDDINQIAGHTWWDAWSNYDPPEELKGRSFRE